jgi:hypothetical protein
MVTVIKNIQQARCLFGLVESTGWTMQSNDLLRNSTLYQEFLAERDEILRHKWLESEKAGHDIGLERALTDWIVKHRSAWRRWRRSQRPAAD